MACLLESQRINVTTQLAVHMAVTPQGPSDALVCQCTDQAAGSVRFKLQLTTPACPVKAEFERQVHIFCCSWVGLEA